MAGGYNSNVTRAYARLRRDNPAEHLAIGIGKRATIAVAHSKGVNELAAFDVDTPDPASNIVVPTLEKVATMFETGEIDSVHLITTEFVSTVKQDVQVSQLLPVIIPEGAKSEADASMEPEPEDLVDFAIRRVLEAELLQAILEARASEQAARMLAMMNATDNADDIIGDLTLEFNNERQSSITQEISEITAGAEAVAK